LTPDGFDSVNSDSASFNILSISSVVTIPLDATLLISGASQVC
jgi:hypothetical protein